MLKIVLVSVISLTLVTAEHKIPRQVLGSIEALRLVGGREGSEREGRLEVFSRGIWGTVCGDHFDIHAANVTCRALGFQGYTGYPVPSNHLFGNTNDDVSILLDDVRCRGNESSLSECQHRPIGEASCTHASDVGVICVGPVGITAIRLVGGRSEREGRLEVMVDGIWGTVCQDRFDNNAASVACRSMGYQSNVSGLISIRLYDHAGYGKPILLDDVTCLGNESSLTECDHRPFGEHNCMRSDDIGITCGKRFGAAVTQVRLVNGSNPDEGRLEVLVNETWGTVCNRYFNDQGARVVCRMLGYRTFGAREVYVALYGEGTLPIIMDSVECRGNEEQLDDCRFDFRHLCSRSQVASVKCGPEPEEVVSQLRLVNGSNPNEGRLEVLVNGTWGTVCDDYFDHRTARVVCRMLGFPTDNAVELEGAYFGEGTGPILLDDVVCRGEEYTLNICRFSRNTKYCRHREDVGVRCGEMTEPTR